ncbi:hypothetical protein RHSIM_Rhsim02G0124200 [Rhododendron simsii]|uniref:Protein kinase domain-containing protein n=1 Tax=Rhododendron simsii TaxID=118357 RepID=A0A834LVV4_RHOSS|nr:hypothetical protein RHSIM_Rhsim02G0124200 [Rhododendron simsii]
MRLELATKRLMHFIPICETSATLLKVRLLGSIPTNNTAPGPDPPVVSTLKSFRELAEFVDMIRVKFEVRSLVKPSNSFWRQTAKGRFHDEMKLLTASSLLSHHDNMVKLIGSGLVNGRLAAVYELDPLDTLRNLLPRDDFGWFSRVKVAIQFASLVEAFHSQNFKLRNICADN